MRRPSRYTFATMDGQGDIKRTDPALRFAAGTLILIFLLRALIPAGFMPDARALGEGRFELVICTSSGERVAHAIDLGAGNGAPETWAGADCPYHLSLSPIAAPDIAPVPVEFAVRAADRFPAASNVLLPPALGPPLGQRAPPVFLA
jgi:hypothetical protein